MLNVKPSPVRTAPRRAVRVATFADCRAMTAFLERMHKELEVAPKFSPAKVTKTLQVAVSNPKLHKAWVAEVDGQIEGVLVGVTNQVWFSGEKEALDMVFVVSERARGYGAFLAQRYMRWALREAAGVRWVYLSQTQGDGPNERLGRMCTRLGFVHIGGVYRYEARK